MEFTVMPKSPRTAIVLVVVLAGAVLFVLTSGGKSKHHKGSGPVAVAAQAAQALADLAVPGPGATAPEAQPATADADTTFGENPFLSADPAGLTPDADDDDETGPAATEEGGIRSLMASTVPQRLLGTIVDGEQRLALIDGRYYSVGQSVGGWQLTAVERGEARLECRGQSITLKVAS